MMSENDDLFDAIYDDLDEKIYTDEKAEEPQPLPSEDPINKAVEFQVRLMERAAELRQKQQDSEIMLATKVLDFINTAKKHAREEQKAMQEDMEQFMAGAAKTASDKKAIVSAIIDSLSIENPKSE